MDLELLNIRKDKGQKMSQSDLISCGWTKKMIQDLLPEPEERENPMFRRASPMKLWNVEDIENAPTVSAVEVVQIKETKQYILQIFDNLIEIDKPLAYEFNEGDPYYKGKLSAFEISRRFVNAALTNLCVEELI